MIRKVRVRVSGRVQGVFFRQSTKNKAREHNIFGTVENLDDGSVEIFAQAEDKNLQIFIDWCRSGPITARVDAIEIIELDGNAPEFFAFVIL